MQAGEPSRTAWGAAGHRAVHQVLEQGRIFRDPLAVTVLGDRLEEVVARARHAPERRGMRTFIAVRHRMADDVVAAAVDRGCRQVVVLGAGLDTFAYRNPFEDSGVRVFEVDHPATQGWKHDRLAETGIRVPASVTYVGVDFEVDDLRGQLGASGVDLAEPVAFLWLGVVPYLTEDAVLDTLGLVADVPDAVVVFDHPVPVDQLGAEARRSHTARARSVERIGEPWITAFDSADLARRLGALGLTVVDDVSPREIAVRWFGAPESTPPRPGGHVVVARRLA